MYGGETFIRQEELEQFLETAKELKVKGLQGEFDGIDQNMSDVQNTCKKRKYSKTLKEYKILRPSFRPGTGKRVSVRARSSFKLLLCLGTRIRNSQNTALDDSDVCH